MPLNTQDLWVVLKAQDLATRALNQFSRSVRKSGADVRLANLEAQRSAETATIAQRRLDKAIQQNELTTTRARLAQEKQTLAVQRSLGIRGQLINQTKLNIVQLEDEVRARQQVISGMGRDIIAHQQSVLNINHEIEAIHRDDEALRKHQQRLVENSNKYRAFSQSAYAASFAVTSLGIVGATALKGAIDAAIEYDRQVRLTFTQVDKGQASLEQLGAIGIKIATSIGVKFDDVQKSLYDTFSSMDVTIQDAEKYVTAFAKAAVAGQTDISNVSRGTIAILNSFHLSASSINDVLDLQFKFIQKGIGTYDEWVSRIGLVAPSAIRAGQSLQTMFAALASASRMQGVASHAATSVARSLDALSNPKAVNAMKKFGVSVLDTKGNLLPLVDILRSFRAQLDKLPSHEAKVAAIQEIFKGAGGTIEARRFLNNLLLNKGDFDQFVSLLDDVNHSAGSLNTAYGIMGQSVSTKTQLLKNRFHALWIEIGNGLIPYFSKMLDWGNKIVAWLDKLSPKTKDTLAKLAGIATGMALIVGPILAILGAIGSLSAALAAIGLTIGTVLAIIAGAVIALVALGAGFVELWKRSEEFRRIFIHTKDTIVDVWNMLKAFAKGVKQDFEKDLAPALKKLWIVIEANVIPAVQHLVDTYEKNIKKSLQDWLDKMRWIVDKGFTYISWAINTLLIPTIQRATKFYYEHQDTIDKVIGVMATLGKWIGIIVGGTVLGLLIAAIIIVIGYISAWITIMTYLWKYLSSIPGYWKWVGNEIAKGAKWIADKFEELYNKTKKFIGQAIDVIKSLPQKVKDAASGAATWLYSVGQDIVHGLAEGFKSKIDAFLGFLKWAWDQIPSSIKSALGISSPSKVFHKIGVNTVQGYVNGIKAMNSTLNNTVNDMGNRMMNVRSGSFAPTYSIYGGSSASSDTWGGGKKNITVNVTTNEIRPQKHAAQLGYLLAGRI